MPCTRWAKRIWIVFIISTELFWIIFYVIYHYCWEQYCLFRWSRKWGLKGRASYSIGVQPWWGRSQKWWCRPTVKNTWTSWRSSLETSTMLWGTLYLCQRCSLGEFFWTFRGKFPLKTLDPLFGRIEGRKAAQEPQTSRSQKGPWGLFSLLFFYSTFLGGHRVCGNPSEDWERHESGVDAQRGSEAYSGTCVVQ